MLSSDDMLRAFQVANTHLSANNLTPGFVTAAKRPRDAERRKTDPQLTDVFVDVIGWVATSPMVLDANDEDGVPSFEADRDQVAALLKKSVVPDPNARDDDSLEDEVPKLYAKHVWHCKTSRYALGRADKDEIPFGKPGPHDISYLMTLKDESKRFTPDLKQRLKWLLRQCREGTPPPKASTKRTSHDVGFMRMIDLTIDFRGSLIASIDKWDSWNVLAAYLTQLYNARGFDNHFVPDSRKNDASCLQFLAKGTNVDPFRPTRPVVYT